MGSLSSKLPYWQARSRALFRELDADPDIFLIGGLISLPFNPDDGLIDRYSDRILWPPISEFCNVGMAIGAAMAGLRPLVAVANSAFSYYAFAALANEAPFVRYLSGGLTSAPAVIHMMVGARGGGGVQHEHTPHAMLQNVPGIRIYAPGTPADIDAALHSALTGNDPAVIADHVMLAHCTGDVPSEPEPEYASCSLLAPGEDSLLVASSLMVQRSLAASEVLSRDGIGAAVLNVRLLSPAPIDAVLQAADRFSTVVLVDESRGPGSPMSHVAAHLAQAGARIRLVSAAHVPSPYSPSLAHEVTPTVERIAAETLTALGG